MKNPSSKDFAALMQRTRIKKKLSQDDVAVQFQVRPNEINSWELHKRAPRFGTAVKWARTLGYEIHLVKVAQNERH